MMLMRSSPTRKIRRIKIVMGATLASAVWHEADILTATTNARFKGQADHDFR
jgi:hypothetical protein